MLNFKFLGLWQSENESAFFNFAYLTILYIYTMKLAISVLWNYQTECRKPRHVVIKSQVNNTLSNGIRISPSFAQMSVLQDSLPQSLHFTSANFVSHF